LTKPPAAVSVSPLAKRLRHHRGVPLKFLSALFVKHGIFSFVIWVLLASPATAQASEPSSGTLIQLSGLSMLIILGSTTVIRAFWGRRNDQ